jgi:transposase
LDKLVLYGTKSNLGKYGYSRDHRPDKLQITVGISELADLEHFSDTYNQVKSRLKEGSLVIFNKGANTTDNILSLLDLFHKSNQSRLANTTANNVVVCAKTI